MKFNSKIFLISLIIIVTRIPFIFNSLGFDLDNLGEILAGKAISEEHIYNVSRFPGYPFSEFLYSIIYNLPIWCINLVTVFFTIGSALMFYNILLLFKINNAMLLSISLSFVPIIFVNSTVSANYIWSLFFILSCTFAILKDKFWISAVCFGLIISTRFNNIIFLPAFLFLIYNQNQRNLKKVLHYFIAFVLFAVLFFLPVIIRYNGDFLHQYGTEAVELKNIISMSTMYLFGIIGCIVFFTIILISFLNSRKFIKVKDCYILNRNYFFIFNLLIISINFIFFLRFPLESSYLIPSIPSLIIVANKFLNKHSMKILAYSFIISPFFFYFNSKSFHFLGIAFINENFENQQLAFSKEINEKICKLPKNSVVCVADIINLLKYNNVQNCSNSKIVRILTKQEIEILKKNNIKIFYTDDADEKNRNEYNIDLKSNGISISPKFILVR